MTIKNKIPFHFVAIPEYFYRSGWIPRDDDKKYSKMMKFLHWSFGKCSPYEKRIPHDGKMITLAPYEFIFGRSASSKESGLTEDELRHQLKLHLDANFIEKTPSSAPGRFTVYRWATENFSENNPQLNPQPSPQLNPQLSTHKLDEENEERYKEFVKKETNKEKEIVLSKIVSLPSIEKMEEILESCEAYIEHHKLRISSKTLRIWVKKFDEGIIIQQLANLSERKHLIPKQESWMEVSMAAIQNFTLNKNFIEEFKAKFNISCIITLKNYCRDTETGNDYQYNLPHEQFKSIINRKYNHKLEGVL